MSNSLLSVVILTYNEEKNLPTCLESLKNLQADIFIVDSFSNDATQEIAKKYHAQFFQHTFDTHAKQWQYALKSLPLKTDWILGLDADQQLMPDLVNELNVLLSSSNNKADGYYIKRRNYFLGQWIKFGGYYPRYLLKLFKKDNVYLEEGELMDHHFYIRGKTAHLTYDLVENNLKEDLDFWLQKHIVYAQKQATEEFHRTVKQKGSFFGNQDERRIFFKNAWNKMPLFIRPFIYFIYRYIFLLGFLDGRKGLIFHYQQAFWYRFTVDAMIFQMKKKDAQSKRNHS